MIKLSHTGTNVRSLSRCLMISLAMDAVWSVISTGGSPASIGCAVDPTEHDPSRLLFRVAPASGFGYYFVPMGIGSRTPMSWSLTDQTLFSSCKSIYW